jgi:hypothetical protein
MHDCNCIEAQWGLYKEYMRETLDYNITIIPLSPVFKCNMNAMMY